MVDLLQFIEEFLLAVTCLYFYKQMKELKAGLLSITSRPTTDSGSHECVVKLIRYVDGYTAEKHSACGSIPISKMTSDWAQSLHPNSPVVSVTTTGHKL